MHKGSSTDRYVSEADLRRRIAELEVDNAALAQRCQAAEDRFGLVLGSIGDHIAVYDAAWRYVYVNDAAAAVLGKPRDELIGKCIWDLWPDAVGNQYYQELHRARETGETIRSDHFYAPFDIWFENCIYPCGDMVAVFSKDVTNRKEAEFALHRSEQRYRALTEAITSVTWSWDPQTGEGDFDKVMAWWESLTAQAKSGPAPFGWLDQLHDGDRPRVEAEWRHSLESGAPFDTRFRLVLADGSEMDIHSRAVPVRNCAGEIVEWVGTMDDVTREQEALRALTEAKNRLSAMIEASPLAVITYSPEGIVQSWNRGAEETFGWTPDEAIGKFSPTVPEDRHDEHLGNLQAVLRGEPLPVTETKRLRRDGTIIDVAIWAAPLRDSSGTPIAVLTKVADITDRKRADAELRRSQESLRLAMRAGRMGYWSRDLVTGEFTWSSELEDLFGVGGSSEPDPKVYLDRIHPEDLRRIERSIDDSIQEGGEFGVEFRFQRGDGSWRWMEGRGQVMCDAESKPVRIDGLVIDITQRKEAERELQESEGRFRLLAETLPVIAWSVVHGKGMDFINQRYFQYSGKDIRTPPEQAWLEVVHPEDMVASREHYRRCLEEGVTWERELRLRRKDGVYRWHLSRLEPVRNEFGEIIRWFGTSTDIHDQKETEAELERRVRERTDELLNANKELEGFTYTVSHDLRAPLRAIMATSMILLDEAGPRLTDDHRALLSRQAHNAKRLGVLIDELLKLSRLGREELKRVRFDLTEIADDLVSELTARGWPVEFEFVVERALSAHGDPKLVRFVLGNLLENACKFSPNGGKIQVGRRGDAFFVSDQGIGFDMRYADKLFLPFERLVTDDQFPGTGIGLANVHRIVQRHGGKIWAESQLGAGSTFYFTLG